LPEVKPAASSCGSSNWSFVQLTGFALLQKR
jgi:hypothetical protein